MGRASKWFRSVFGFKKPDATPQQTQTNNTRSSKEKKRWSFVKSYREKNNQSQTSTTNVPVSYGYYSSEFDSQDLDNDPNKRAIAVAAATAAVAEAAVVAAKAAAEVVRLTSSGRCRKDGEYDDQDSCRDAAVNGGLKSSGGGWVEEFAAVKIQAAFRGYLARRALRALRALVSIQALVRGHIARKRAAVELKQMQAVVRAQARARAGRARLSCPLSTKSSHSHRHQRHHRIASKSNAKSTADDDKAYLSLSWSECRTEPLTRTLDKAYQSWSRAGPLTRTRSIEDEKTSDKILEIDTGKHHSAQKRRSLSHSSHHAFHSLQYSHSFTTSKDSTLHSIPSLSSGEANSYGIFNSVEEEVFCTAENSPQLYSTPSVGGSVKRTPDTPARSDCSQSSMSVYSNYPNYLSNTESSRAKMRSLSAPKQRPQYERSVSIKRYGEQRSSSAKRAFSLHTNCAIKDYPGSGYLDRFGMPVGL